MGWVNVSDRLPEKEYQDVLVTDGYGYAVGYWRPDAKAWDNECYGWLERNSDDEEPCRLGKVTHWMEFEPFPGIE